MQFNKILGILIYLFLGFSGLSFLNTHLFALTLTSSVNPSRLNQEVVFTISGAQPNQQVSFDARGGPEAFSTSAIVGQDGTVTISHTFTQRAHYTCVADQNGNTASLVQAVNAPLLILNTPNPVAGQTVQFIVNSLHTVPINFFASFQSSSRILKNLTGGVDSFPFIFELIFPEGDWTGQYFLPDESSNVIHFTVRPSPAPLPAIFPPSDLQGFRKITFCNKKTNFVNVITWQPPESGETPTAYQIYRDAALTNFAGRVAANEKLIFKDRNIKFGEINQYYIVSVGTTISESEKIEIGPCTSYQLK